MKVAKAFENNAAQTRDRVCAMLEKYLIEDFNAILEKYQVGDLEVKRLMVGTERGLQQASFLDVKLLEFGIPEAMWRLRVTDFPAIVTMDAHGNSLHADVEKASAAVLAKLAEPVF